MKRKRNIYDADDAAKSKRLHFSAEERAAHAEKKAEILGEKLEKAKADLPKKRRARINREFDAMTGKVRHSLSFEDEVKPRSRKNPVARAGLKAGRTVDLAAHSKIRQVEKENVGTEAAHKTEFAAENLTAGAIRKGYRSVKDAPYRKVERLEVKSARATVNANYHAAVRDNPELQKHSLSALFQKRKLKREYAKAYREARKTGSRGAAVAKKAKEAVSNAGQAAVALVKNNRGILVIVGGVALLFILLFSSLSSCSVSMEGAMGAVLGTSYTSEDPDILQVEDNYIALEQGLERRMANIESEFPGYDEYQYDVDTIGHDPNELISYLTAKFNAFTPAQVQAELEALFDQQYTLTTREEVQIRYRTVTWTDEEGNEHESEEAYEYYILHVTLRNHSLGTVAMESLTEDEKGRYVEVSFEIYRVYEESRKQEERQRYERRKHIEGKSFDDCLLYDLATEPLEETAERLETLLEIGCILEKLPPLQRWRFILHFFYGYSYSEIAKMQDCNKSAVMRSVHSALKKIRKKVAA